MLIFTSVFITYKVVNGCATNAAVCVVMVSSDNTMHIERCWWYRPV